MSCGKLILHICCAPCSVIPISIFRSEGYDIRSFWYNPNIHPKNEYDRRRETLARYAGEIRMDLYEAGSYGIDEFVEATSEQLADRCGYCYSVRLDKAAEFAKTEGYEAFSTTLLVSPYQKHDLIASIGKAAGEKYGVEFVYRDFRQRFREGQSIAREAGMYMQKYCGCIFSKYERLINKR